MTPESFAQLMAFQLPANGRLAIGVGTSGGPDSTALLGLLAEFRGPIALELHVLHVDHQLRGEESNRDRVTCQALASRLGLPFHVRPVPTVAYGQRYHLSIETAARELRLAAFKFWSNELGLARVATGHSADDQVETVLHHLWRGTSLQGCAGMATLRPLVSAPRHTARGSGNEQQGMMWRPLLNVRRAQLHGALSRLALLSCDDSSNQDLSFRRNWLRKVALPALRQQVPRIDAGLLALATRARAATESLHTELAPWVENALSGRGGVALDLRRGKIPTELHAPLLRHLWNIAPQRRSGGLTRAHFFAFSRLLASGRGGELDLPGGSHMELASGQLYLWKPKPSFDGGCQSEALTRSDFELPWIPARVQWNSIPTRSVTTPSGAHRLFLADTQANELVRTGTHFRKARPADRILLTNGVRARVTELLRGAGLAPCFRPSFPVLVAGSPTDDGQVLWIPGIRVSPRTWNNGTHAGRLDTKNPRLTLCIDLIVDPQSSPGALALTHMIRER